MKPQSQKLDFGVLKLTSEQALLSVFIFIVLAFRLALIDINAAEYTDGILQITMLKFPELSNGNMIWPPLYAILSQALHYTGLSLESAAKLVSILSSVAVFIPLYYIGRMVNGKLCGLLTVLVYAAQPMAWRWSIRVMTESLYVFLFTLSILLVLIALQEMEKQTLFKLRAFVNKRIPPPNIILGLSIIAGVLCGMTRFTGVILIPIYLYCIWCLLERPSRSRGMMVLIPAVAMLGWLIIFWWILKSPHQGQFGERTGSALGITLINYLNVAESFVYLYPYYITFPIFLFGLWGWARMFATEDPLHRQFCWLMVYFTIMILGMQSVFQAFQSRYLLPLVPFFAVTAGYAFAGLIRRAKQQRFAHLVVGAILIHSLAWSAAVVIMQRGTFGEIKAAAMYIKSLDLPNTTQIFCHEVYNPGMGIHSVKMSYWSGKKVKPFPLINRSGKPMIPDDIPEGSYVVLISTYTSRKLYPLFRSQLYSKYSISALPNSSFHSYNIPIFDDIMEMPGTGQNPSGWVYRYRVQNFNSTVYRIGKRKTYASEMREF